MTGRTGRRARWVSAGLLGAALCLCSGIARSHDLDSASLSLTEVGGGRFLVRWRASSRTLQEDLSTAVIFPRPCRLQGAELACGTSGLVGSIEFPWIEGTSTRAVVDIEWQNGTRLLRVVTPSGPSLRVYGLPASGWRALEPVLVDYTKLGVAHILTGFDHLLFVVALALLVRRGRQLLVTITAFTLAHSLSLARHGARARARSLSPRRSFDRALHRPGLRRVPASRRLPDQARAVGRRVRVRPLARARLCFRAPRARRARTARAVRAPGFQPGRGAGSARHHRRRDRPRVGS